MNRIRALLFAAAAAFSYGAQAQHSVAAQRPPTSPPPEARQFDFLIGQWELDVHPKVNSLAAMIHGAPQLTGTWKAWRAFDGFGIDDEMRIVDSSGNPLSLSHAMRVYGGVDGRWTVTSVDVYRGRVAESSGRLQEGDIVLDGKGTDAEGKPIVTRARFSAIRPDSFRLQQDRSADNGATWDEGVLVVAARRVAAAASR